MVAGSNFSVRRFFLILLQVSFLLLSSLTENPPRAEDLPSIPMNGSTTVSKYGTIRVNIPYFTNDIHFDQCAVLWFGEVNSTENFSDVRIGYNNDELYIRTAVFDRWIWYDTDPNPENLTDWDALTIYLYTGDSPDDELDGNAYQFIGQLSPYSDANYTLVRKGENGSWVDTSISVSSTPGWRGNALNNNTGDDRGWTLAIRIPFQILGFLGAPTGGTVWRMAIVLHDRDNAEGTIPIPDKFWPSETISATNPSTWAKIAFGLPRYTPSTSTVADSVMVRDRYEEARVGEISVGGSTVCGEGRDFWTEWGEMNDPENTTLIVQNQSDVADWPCFSKIFFEFPLSSVPPNKEIVEAKLVVYLFGGSDPSQAQPSYIQVLIVGSEFNINSITWNSAPLASENIGGTWVYPVLQFPGWPGIRYEWDVSYAASQAYAAGKPLRLALYSADSSYHSGKYFVGSNDDGWNEEGRPTLHVYFGEIRKITMPWVPLLLED